MITFVQSSCEGKSLCGWDKKANRAQRLLNGRSGDDDGSNSLDRHMSGRAGGRGGLGSGLGDSGGDDSDGRGGRNRDRRSSRDGGGSGRSSDGRGGSGSGRSTRRFGDVATVGRLSCLGVTLAIEQNTVQDLCNRKLSMNVREA